MRDASNDVTIDPRGPVPHGIDPKAEPYWQRHESHPSSSNGAADAPAILLVGLDPGVAKAVVDTLTTWPVNVAESGHHALEWLAKSTCVTLVIGPALPDMAAIELVRRLTEQARTAATPVLFCTPPGAAGKLVRTAVERLGVAGFLPDPPDVTDVVNRIASITGVEISTSRHEANERSSGPAFTGAPEPPEPAALRGWTRFRDQVEPLLSRIEHAAVRAIEGDLDETTRSHAWLDARRLGDQLAAFGLTDPARATREIELMLERPLDGAPGTALRLSRLAVAVREDIERPVPHVESGRGGPASPLLLIVNLAPDHAEAVAVEAEARGLRHEAVSTAAELRDALEAQTPSVVLIDLDGGKECLALIGEIAHRANVPILVSATSASLADRVAVSRAGGRTFLRKPLSPGAAVEAAFDSIRRAQVGGNRVLVLDDDLHGLARIRDALTPLGVDVTVLDDPRRFWEMMEAVRPDMVLLDLYMPHHSGLELCQVVRCDERWSRTIVLVIGDGQDPYGSHLAYVAGADDYVARPFAPAELATRIGNRLERQRLSQDQAGLDVLTGVATRRRSEDALDGLVRIATRYRQPLSLAVLNVDGLRAVNESCGVAVGDAVLRRLARLLRDSFRVEDVVGRCGGDEFVCGGFGFEKDDLLRRLSTIREWFSGDQFRAGDVRLSVTFTAGVAGLYADGDDLPSLWHAAEDSLAEAKTMGRGSVQVAGWSVERMAGVQVVDVVIVDGDESMAGLLLHALGTNGFSTKWLADGDGAIDVLCGAQPRLRARVVLLDIDLPTRDGFAILRALRRDGVLSRCRVIVVTQRANEAEVVKAFEAGAFDHVAKPFSVPVLLQRVRRAIRP